MMLPGMELLSCPEMAVPREVMQHVVRVESSHNPFAIGVVGGRLVRQPKNLDEALATVRMLESRGFNFSVGIAQVNRYNLPKYGLASYTQAFQVCPNLQAGARILAECYQRHKDWGKSFSCYYSGNPVTGFRHGYVQKVFASIAQARGAGSPTQTAADGIEVVPRPSRRSVAVEHFPLRTESRVEPTPARATPLGSMQVPASTDPAMVGGAVRRAVQSADLTASQAPMATPTVKGVPNPAPSAPVLLQATQPALVPSSPPPNAPPMGGDGAFVF